MRRSARTTVAATTVVGKVVSYLGGEEEAGDQVAERSAPSVTRRRSRATGDAGVLVKGISDIQVKLARCCTPVPGDAILGFITKGGAVSVHRVDCTNAASLRAGAGPAGGRSPGIPTSASVFLVTIQVEALDRARLLSDITKTLADVKVNILSANLSMSKDGMAISRFSFEMADPKHLGHLLRIGAQRRGRLRRLPGDQRLIVRCPRRAFAVRAQGRCEVSTGVAGRVRLPGRRPASPAACPAASPAWRRWRPTRRCWPSVCRRSRRTSPTRWPWCSPASARCSGRARN